MADIRLSAAMAVNLAALQRTTAAILKTQERLSTGLRINGAIGGAAAFLDAQILSTRAASLLVIKDKIKLAISKVDAAVTGIAAVKAIVEQMKGLAQSALSDGSATTRSKSAVQFNDLRGQLNNLVNDSTFLTTNLLRATPDNLTITFSHDVSSSLTISGIASDATTLGISLASSNFGPDSNVDTSINQLDAALVTLRGTDAVIGSQADLLSLRLDFTDTLVDALEDGAGKLVNADLNHEAAQLLTLQTREQLGSIGIAVIQQSEQAVLRLFD